MPSLVFERVVALITLWVEQYDKCVPYLESLPRDAFEPLSMTDGLRLLMFFFFSASIEEEKIREHPDLYVDDGNLFQKLDDFIRSNSQEFQYPSYEDDYEDEDDHVHEELISPESTGKVSVALSMFTLLFSRGLTIQTEYLDGEYVLPSYSLIESVIDWILSNSTHIEPTTVRDLYRPFLCHYQEQSDGYFFLLSLVTRIFEDPETAEEDGNIPIRKEFLMELLPVLKLKEFFEGTHNWTTCPALVIFPPHLQFFEAENGWETTEYSEDSRVFFPREEDFDPEYEYRYRRARPRDPAMAYPFPDIPEGQYFDPQYRERWNLWQEIVKELREPIALPTPEDVSFETQDGTSTTQPFNACSASKGDSDSSSDDEDTEE